MPDKYAVNEEGYKLIILYLGMFDGRVCSQETNWDIDCICLSIDDIQLLESVLDIKRNKSLDPSRYTWRYNEGRFYVQKRNAGGKDIDVCKSISKTRYLDLIRFTPPVSVLDAFDWAESILDICYYPFYIALAKKNCMENEYEKCFALLIMLNMPLLNSFKEYISNLETVTDEGMKAVLGKISGALADLNNMNSAADESKRLFQELYNEGEAYRKKLQNQYNKKNSTGLPSVWVNVDKKGEPQEQILKSEDINDGLRKKLVEELQNSIKICCNTLDDGVKVDYENVQTG